MSEDEPDRATELMLHAEYLLGPLDALEEDGPVHLGRAAKCFLELAALFSAKSRSRRMFEAMAGVLVLEALDQQAEERRQRTERKARQ